MSSDNNAAELSGQDTFSYLRLPKAYSLGRVSCINTKDDESSHVQI